MLAPELPVAPAGPLDQLVAAVHARDERGETGEPLRGDEHRRILSGAARRRNVALAIHDGGRQAPPVVTDEAAIVVGDRVVHLQVPGVFTVVAVRGDLIDVENERGLRMTIHRRGLRRVAGVPA
jgi:hypothetical protein